MYLSNIFNYHSKILPMIYLLNESPQPTIYIVVNDKHEIILDPPLKIWHNMLLVFMVLRLSTLFSQAQKISQNEKVYQMTQTR